MSGRQQLVDLLGAHAGDQRQAAGVAVGVEALAQGHHLVGRGGGADLRADRVADAGEELQVGAVELAGAVADPDHVGRAVVPVAGEGVDPGQALLVGEDQRLVARPEVDLVQAVLGSEVDAAGGHEPQGTVDLRRDALVALALRLEAHELLVPQVHLGQVGEPALGEGPQQVERGGRLVVGGDERARGRACGPRRRSASSLTMWPRNDGELDAADALGGATERGLANCPAMRPTLTTGTPAA